MKLLGEVKDGSAEKEGAAELRERSRRLTDVCQGLGPFSRSSSGLAVFSLSIAFFFFFGLSLCSPHPCFSLPLPPPGHNIPFC